MADWDICASEGELFSNMIPYASSGSYYDAAESRASILGYWPSKILFPSAETKVFGHLRVATGNGTGTTYYPSIRFFSATDVELGSLEIAINQGIKIKGLVSGVLTNTPDYTPIQINGVLSPQIKVMLDTATGQMKLFVNGGEVLSLSVDANSTPIAYATVNLLGASVMYVSSLAFTTKNRALNRVLSKYPTATGLDVDGVGAWTDIDEAVATQTDVVTMSAAGQRRSVKSNAPNITTDVVGFHVTCYAVKEDGTGPQNIRPYVKIAGTRYYGPNYALTTALKAFIHNFTVNPATSANWTSAVLNDAAFEYGWETVA